MNSHRLDEMSTGHLSSTAQLQIQPLRRFRGHPTTHAAAIASLVALIQAGDIVHPDDVRAFCASEEWTEAEIASLSRTIDDVGATLQQTGLIRQWY